MTRHIEQYTYVIKQYKKETICSGTQLNSIKPKAYRRQCLAVTISPLTHHSAELV